MLRSRWTKVLVLLALVVALGCASAPPAPTPPAPMLPTSATAGGTSIVAIAPPAQQCCPKQTLPQFLGLTGLARGIGGLFNRLRNRLGSIWPGLEAKPAVLAITDPANLESDNPAVAEAAAVKAEEDGAAQKAKAISYLASVGCSGCYPGVEDALLAALDDCTEEVRFAAANGLRASAAEPCKNCRTSACCGPKIREKLEKMAYDQDANGCYVEPSDRVRRVARLALCNCSTVPPRPTKSQQKPQEGPDAAEGPPVEAAAESPAVAATPGEERSIIARSASSAPAVGSGVESPKPTRPTMATRQRETARSEAANSQPVPARPAVARPSEPTPASRQVSYEEVLSAYQTRGTPRSEPQEIAWEQWTVPVHQFASRQDAIAAMMIARTQAMSAGGQVASPQIRKFTHEWMSAEQITSPSLARIVEQMPVGGVSGVIEDRGGLHMIRVLGRRAAVPTPAAPASASDTTLATRPAAAVTVPVIVRLPPCDCQR